MFLCVFIVYYWCFKMVKNVLVYLDVVCVLVAKCLRDSCLFCILKPFEKCILQEL